MHPRFNSLAPGRYKCAFEIYLSDWYLDHFQWNCPRMNATRWTDDKSTVVQEMAWCHQTTGHYLKQCWPCFMTLSGITRDQGVNSLVPGKRGIIILHLVIFKLIPRRAILAIACEITLGWMSQDLTDNLVNIGSGNGLVRWGNKLLAQLMLTHIYIAIWSHYATMS